MARTGLWTDYILTGRSMMIRGIVEKNGPITAAGVRRNLIEWYGCNVYTDLTASEVRAHMKKHMRDDITIYDRQNSVRYVLTDLVPK